LKEAEMAKSKKQLAQVEMGADTETAWTMSIPDAGRKYFGLGKFAAYRAAEDGLIPYVQVGRLKRALPRKIEAKLAGGDD
jgi:hypothetical protein